MEIGSRAKVIQGGGAVLVRATLSCHPGYEPLEAHLTVSHNDHAVIGTGGIRGVRYDGRLHDYRVRVRAQEGTYREGTAYASGYLLVINPTTSNTQSASSTRTVEVR